MARPTIDDYKHVREIAIVLRKNYGMKFSEALRIAKPRMGEIECCQSEDSFRRRLQRKWNKKKEYWQRRADEEIKERFRQRLEQVFGNFAKNMRPVGRKINAAFRSPEMLEFFETLQRVSKQMEQVSENFAKNMRPVTININAAFRSSEMLESFETLKRFSKQMEAIRMPGIEALERVQRQHCAFRGIRPPFVHRVD